jgi:hypothetical protein
MKPQLAGMVRFYYIEYAQLYFVKRRIEALGMAIILLS